MLHGQAQFWIGYAGSRAGRVGFNHHQPAVDLLPPVHPRGVLLADETALGEADAVQFHRIALEPEDLAELPAPLGNTEAEAMAENNWGPMLDGLKATAEAQPQGSGRRS